MRVAFALAVLLVGIALALFLFFFLGYIFVHLDEANIKNMFIPTLSSVLTFLASGWLALKIVGKD